MTESSTSARNGVEITAGKPALGVTEIANVLSLSKAVVHRLLTTFAAKGRLIEFDEDTHRYGLGR